MSELTGVKILVIEDMQELLIFHRRWLGIEKAEFHGSMTGADGIKTFQEVPGIELILLDMLLPDMHGMDVLKKIREATETIPIIVCSGFNDNMDDLMRYPRVRFIGKPFVLPELKKMLVEMLQLARS